MKPRPPELLGATFRHRSSRLSHPEKRRPGRNKSRETRAGTAPGPFHISGIKEGLLHSDRKGVEFELTCASLARAFSPVDGPRPARVKMASGFCTELFGAFDQQPFRCSHPPWVLPLVGVPLLMLCNTNGPNC
jgi:hypothetical protein